jgi:hypothetical protein
LLQQIEQSPIGSAAAAIAGGVQETRLGAGDRNVLRKLFDGLEQRGFGLAVIARGLRRARLIQQRAGILRRREIPECRG